MAMFNPEINAGVAQSLRDIVGGGTATQYISEQNDMRRRMNPINESLSLADLERVNLANEQSRVTNPLEATIKGSQAREAAGKDDVYFKGMREGQLADARLKGTEADIAGATKDSTIAHTNAKLSNEQRAMFNKEIKDIAIWISESVDPKDYPEALTQFASKIPGVVENPMFQMMLKKDPTKILEFMKNIGDKGRAADPQLRNADRISAEDNITKEKVANIQAGATRYAADARKKDISAEQIATLRKEAAKGNPEAFLMLADLAKESGDMMATQRYTELAKQAALRREAERRASGVGRPDVGAMGIPAQGSSNPYGTSETAPRKWNSQTGKWE
jgi:hypothetical protein